MRSDYFKGCSFHLLVDYGAWTLPEHEATPANTGCVLRSLRSLRINLLRRFTHPKTLEAFLKLGFRYQRDRVGETRYYC